METGIYVLIELIDGKSLAEIGNSEGLKRVTEQQKARNDLAIDISSKILKFLGLAKPELLMAGELLEQFKNLMNKLDEGNSPGINLEEELEKLSPELKAKVAEAIVKKIGS